jgi:structural maintenance of chromosomes protein 5
MQYLGRAKEPSEFVKHGSREATIEIELQRKPNLRKNPVITRVIKRENNQSTFLTNGKSSSAREVQLLANSFNIQIDNLCQFLPQDKVVEFAQLSPVDLLTSTQRAVAGPEMTRYQDDLKKLRANQTSELQDDKEAQSRLENLEGRQALQRTEVERMKEREQVQLRLRRLERSRVMLRYNEAKAKSQKAKVQAQAASRELRALKASTAPILAQLRSRQQYEERARDYKVALERELKAGVALCGQKTKDITNIDSQIQEKNNQIENEKKGTTKAKEAINREQGKLRGYRRKKAEEPGSFDVTGLTEEIKELKRRSNELQNQINELTPRKADLRASGRNRMNELNVLDEKIKTFGSHADQQEARLRSLSSDTAQAWIWIQNHQDQFSGRVFGPPIVECSLKDPAMADAVESILQPSDFKFITVQNKVDFHKLQKQLFGPASDGGLALHDVSLRECGSDNLEQYQAPLNHAEMEGLGLSGWILDHIKGPATVLAQLCQERSIHRCGLARKEPSQQQHDELARTEVSSYVTDKKVYQFLRRKEYGAAGISARVQGLRKAQRWTDQPVDLGRKAALERERNEARGEAEMLSHELRELDSQIKQIKTEKDKVDEEYAAKQEQKEAKQRARSEYEALDISIRACEERIETQKDNIRGVGARIEEIQTTIDDLFVKKTERVLELADAARAVRTKTEQLLGADMILIEATSDLQVAEAQNTEVVNSIEQKTAEEAEAKQLFREQHDIALKTRDVAKDLAIEAKALTDNGDDSFELLLEAVCREIKTPEDLEAEIDAEKAKLELTEGGDAGIIAEFERRASDIETLKAQVQAAIQRRKDFRRAIEDIRSKWEPQLDEYVGRINDAFADSFARIGCAGQVAVHKASSIDPLECTEEYGGAENGLDFANWAIHISVKFRESEPLSLLDSHRQSGGERAVSTIFYLMALQSLSRAPFRVVDEINQGMDPRNERMVHGRMVDIAADDGGSQYFLITPKLLSGLKYRRGMTVLCIVSGENVPAARQRNEAGRWENAPKVDFRQFVNKARQLGLAGPGFTGRRVDSGLGLNSISPASVAAV